MSDGEGGCRVVVVGVGAAGALTATHLVTSLSQRYQVVLVDPASTTARGPAYATEDARHLLNVPAGQMSALPYDAEHFLRWLRRHHGAADPDDFVPRRVYGEYLERLLEDAAQFPGNARLARHHARVLDVQLDGHRLVVSTSSGTTYAAAAVVLAMGSPVGTHWAPADLAAAGDRFVTDPWSQPVPEGDLLVVGTGLTMVDQVLSLDRPGRTLHVVSRRDELPRAHRRTATPPVPPPPGLTRATTLADLRDAVDEHVRRVVLATGDWRAAVDGLRPLTACLWQGLSESDKAEFLRTDARTWDVHRHRMSPRTAAAFGAVVASGRVVRHRGTVLSGRGTPGGVEVALSDGTSVRLLEVAAVLNCTGSDHRPESDGLLAPMIEGGLLAPGPAGLGVRTTPDGRAVGRTAHSAPLFVLGALRRGELWETTALPEIRQQAWDVAQAVTRTLRGERSPRPVDLYDLPLTADPDAATAYNDALGRLLRLQDGVEDALHHAVDIDPGFTQAHAALALLDHEWGTRGSWAEDLARAHESAARRHLDDRELGFLDAVTTRLRADESEGARALLGHIGRFPRDAVAVSVAVPTVAFGGLTSGSETATLVEGLGRAYGDDWWYAGQLAFVRQDQCRWDEAEELATYSLSVEPASGHAVHARAHVFYERGDHAAGLRWLQGWITTSGRAAAHRSHFSWHAALHELVLGDVDAVRRRYDRELAVPSVTGFRALVDGGALLWRCRMAESPLETLDAARILAMAPDGWLVSPPTPFAALHVALSLAAASDAVGLAALRTTSLAHGEATFRDVVGPVCAALQAMLERHPDRAVRELRGLLPRAAALGGSAAQRDVLEETLLHALALSGRGDEAAALLDQRLDRRPSPLDVRRRAWLRRSASEGSNVGGNRVHQPRR